MNIYFNEYMKETNDDNAFGYHSVSFDSTNDLVMFVTNECHTISQTPFGKDESIAAARAILAHFWEATE